MTKASGPVREFSVRIRLNTVQVSAEEITRLLGISPTEVHGTGDEALPGREWKSNVWGWQTERIGSL